MARRASLANAFTKGVLDPALCERIDLEHYYNGLAKALNIEVFPQGGFRRRGGTTTISKLRHRLKPFALTAGMLTAPNGGTVAHLVDQSDATRFASNVVAGGAFVLVDIDLAAHTSIAFVDVIGFGCTAGRFPRALAVEYLSGSTWTAFAPDIERARKAISDGIFTETIGKDNLSQAAGGVVRFVAPFDGKIVKLKTKLDGAITGGNLVLDLKIADTAVTNGQLTVTEAGSAAGDVDETVPTAANAITVGQEITVAFSRNSWGGATLDLELVLEQAPAVRSRRFGLAPGNQVTAQRWRLVAYDAAGAGAVGIAGLRLWQEKGQLSPKRGVSFARESDLIFEHVLSDRNIDVFRDGVWQAAIAVDVDAQQVDEVNITQSLDTAMLYHEDIQTPRVTHQGATDEWDAQPSAFLNVPLLSSGTAFGGDRNEIQAVRLPGLVAGDAVAIWLGGKVSGSIAYGAGFAAAVEAALEALGVPSGVTVATIAGTVPGVRITFQGNAGGRRWPLVSAVVLSRDDVEPATTIEQRGLDADGPMMGDTTGWPRAGVFYQERHILAGFRAAPLTFGVSRFGQEFDFEDDGDPFTADLGFFGTLNSDRLETIHEIFVGRHLLFLTESGEWFGEARTIDATQPFNVQLGTRVGLRSAVPVAFIDGSVLFVQKGGRVMRDLLFSDAELSYTADPLTLLAPHLMTDVVDLGYRSQRSTDEGNHILLVNADGTIAFMALLKSQKVVAMAPWSTDGLFLRAFGDVDRRMWLIVERTSNGVPEHYLELHDDTHVLDAAVEHDLQAPTTMLTGHGHLDGKSVWAIVDGAAVGPLACAAGAVVLPAAATGTVVVGLFPQLSGELPRLREKLQTGYPWRPPARIYELEVAYARTGHLEIAVNGAPFREVPLADGSRTADTTGYARITNLRGFSRHPLIQFRQTRPEPLEVRALRYEVVHG